MSLPTLLVFVDGEEVFRASSLHPNVIRDTISVAKDKYLNRNFDVNLQICLSSHDRDIIKEKLGIQKEIINLLASELSAITDLIPFKPDLQDFLNNVFHGGGIESIPGTYTDIVATFPIKCSLDDLMTRILVTFLNDCFSTVQFIMGGNFIESDISSRIFLLAKSYQHQMSSDIVGKAKTIRNEIHSSENLLPKSLKNIVLLACNAFINPTVRNVHSVARALRGLPRDLARERLEELPEIVELNSLTVAAVSSLGDIPSNMDEKKNHQIKINDTIEKEYNSFKTKHKQIWVEYNSVMSASREDLNCISVLLPKSVIKSFQFFTVE